MYRIKMYLCASAKTTIAVRPLGVCRRSLHVKVSTRLTFNNWYNENFCS